MLDVSSSSNGLLLHPHISSTNSSFPAYAHCYFSKPGSVIFSTFFIINIAVLLPLCIFILHYSTQEWQKRRSASSAASMSHSDCFTYHMVVMELVGVSGCLISFSGIYIKNFNVIKNAFLLFNINYNGQALFQVLTCVERYVAVVHPITYLSLRRERGVRMRNIIISCVWLLCFASMALVLNDKVNVIIGLCFISLTLMVISFCSLSVLYVLIHPGPGEQGGDRKKVDRSKHRAFYTIVVILGMLLLKFVPALIWASNFASGDHTDCVMMTFDFWFYLPSSLVLPLLLLHRAGKIRCCKLNAQ